MHIRHLRTCHLLNPLGFQIDRPVFSFTVESSASRRLTRCRIEVAYDPAFSEPVFDSGWRTDISPCAFEADFHPQPLTRYYWRVKATDETGACAVSDTVFFEMGKAGTPWNAQWITASSCSHPLFRRKFSLPSAKIRSARIYLCGLGLYELYVNGRRVGDEYLCPHCNNYDLWLQTQTFDLTDALIPGQNSVSVLLGEGWYKGRFSSRMRSALFGDQYALIAELHIVLSDGTKIDISTDTAWRFAPSPILSSSIYDGEIADARRLSLLSDETCWQNAAPLSLGTDRLADRFSPPVTVHERISSPALLHTKRGETVLDFGQNMAGWVEFDSALPDGGHVTFQYGEVLQDGCFYRENLRTAKAEYTYVSDGVPRHVRPHFTFYGFRYVKVMGDLYALSEINACVLHSALDRTGYIETSNAKVNRLFQNALWGQKSNFIDVPTDCPQRDERMGWTGDAQVFARTACYNMDCAAFYRKYMHDMLLEQGRFQGSVPYMVPEVFRKDIRGIGRDEMSVHGSCAWGDAATIIPWTLYQMYGDRALLKEQFPSMTAWVEYIRRCDEADGAQRLWKTGFHFADWLSLDNPDPNSCAGGTDPYFIASCYYYISAFLTTQAAEVLHEDEAHARYARLAQEVRSALLREYFEDGQLRVRTQTAAALVLSLQIVPPAREDALIALLREKLAESEGGLTTGFVGTPCICPALSAHGANASAYSLLLREDYPSWLYQVNLGTTTIWERWNSLLPDGRISSTGMNSLNHYAYGSIVQWMYETIGGLRPAAPGFRAALVRPQPDPRLSWADVRYRSASGEYRVAWRYHADSIVYDLTIPFHCSAVFIPGAAVLSDILAFNSEFGDAIREVGKGKEIQLALQSGAYRIAVRRNA